MTKTDKRIAEIAACAQVTEEEIRKGLADGSWVLCDGCLYPCGADFLITTVDEEETLCEGCADDYDEGYQSVIRDAAEMGVG